MLFSLVLLALVSFAVAIFLYASGYAMLVPIHLALATGAMPLITGAMIYFVPVLTRSSQHARRIHALPWLMLLAGMLAVSSFLFPSTPPALRIVAAILGITTAAILAWWIFRLSHNSLGGSHPGAYWYQAAMIFLLIGLLAVLLMQHWPSQYLALRRFHLHLNTLGFIAITAVGTLQVLLPTALGQPDMQAAQRLRNDLKWVVAGTVLIAAGAAWVWPLIWPGLLCWLWPLVCLGKSWLSLYRSSPQHWNANCAAIAGSLPGLLIIFVLGAAHASKLVSTIHASLAFVFIFLFPLVTSAASYLIPLWIRPGMQTEWHTRTRLYLARFSQLRLALFIGSGILISIGLLEWGWPLATIAMGLFFARLIVLITGLTKDTTIWS